MNILLKNRLTLIGLIAGALGGYLYYFYIGCAEGCTITSQPVNSTLYGAMMGGLLFNMFQKKEVKTEENAN